MLLSDYAFINSDGREYCTEQVILGHNITPVFDLDSSNP